MQGLEIRCVRLDNKIMYEPTWPVYFNFPEPLPQLNNYFLGLWRDGY
jgi:hypothetical protein